MKKIFLFVAMVLFSVSVFADSRSCTVYNANGVIATLLNSTDNVNPTGDVYATVNLNTKAPRNIEVVVNVYDLASGAYITSETVYISSGNTSNGVAIKVGKSYKICTFKINSASCQ